MGWAKADSVRIWCKSSSFSRKGTGWLLSHYSQSRNGYHDLDKMKHLFSFSSDMLGGEYCYLRLQDRIEKSMCYFLDAMKKIKEHDQITHIPKHVPLNTSWE